MRRWKLASLIVFVALISFVLCMSSVFGQTKATTPATPATPAKPATPVKTIELNYSIFFGPTHRHSVLATEWGKEVEKRTNGRVKVTMFYGGTLTPADKCYDGVVNGISDIGMSVLAYTRGKFPLTEVADLPMGIKSGLVATKLINEYFAKFSPKEFDEVKVMYLHGHGPGLLHSKKPIRKLADVAGKKIRCTGMATKIVTALGGTPVAMPMGETYDALSRGVVDATMAPYEALDGWKWGEVIKATTEDYGASYSTGFFVVMNKNKWNALPKDVQKAIEALNLEWIEKTGKTWDEIDKAGKEKTLKLENKVITLSPEEDAKWARAVKPILDEYANNMKAKGLPGDEVLKYYMEQMKKLQ